MKKVFAFVFVLLLSIVFLAMPIPAMPILDDPEPPDYSCCYAWQYYPQKEKIYPVLPCSPEKFDCYMGAWHAYEACWTTGYLKFLNKVSGNCPTCPTEYPPLFSCSCIQLALASDPAFLEDLQYCDDAYAFALSICDSQSSN